MKVQAVAKMCRHLGGRLLFNVKKNSPVILMISAGVAGIGCVVSACMATRKLDPVLEHHNETLQETKDIIENEPEHFDEKQGRKMITKVYARTGLRLAKLYAPAAVLGGIAFACATGSYKIQLNRITYLSGALAVAERRLQSYQLKERAEEVNKIKDPEERKKAAERPLSNENFKVRWAYGDDYFVDPRVFGPYANADIARENEDYLNHILPIRGTVFWNDVLVLFGKKPTRNGAKAGWVFNPKGGEHQIDLGLLDPCNALFMAGEDTEGGWLIPNCETYILDKMEADKQEMWQFYNSEEGRRKTNIWRESA